MKKIILILPYFGKLPNYFPFWLQSVKNNPTIDWLLFTDNELKSIPDNLKVISLSFTDFAQKFHDFFPFEVKLNSPYKLCDYKIFYGEVLKEYVKDFDFWGFCDCDLIWGNIRKFVTDDMLFEFNHLFGLGHFQLQRVEDPEYLNILRKTKAKGKYDYKYVLNNDENFVIDELPFGLPLQYFKENPEKYYNEFNNSCRPYEDVYADYFEFIDGYNGINELGNKYRRMMYFEYRDSVTFWQRTFDKSIPKKKNILYRYSEGNLEKIYFQNGQLKSTELLYVHFMKRKFKVRTENRDRYNIVPNSFVDYVGDPSKLYMWYYGRKRLNVKFLIKRIRIGLGRLKQKIYDKIPT